MRQVVLKRYPALHERQVDVVPLHVEQGCEHGVQIPETLTKPGSHDGKQVELGCK